nr:hypothetical protein [Tanacetum cinerariifolium]
MARDTEDNRCGFKGCVVCGKDTNCVRLSASSKQSYVGHKRYLPYNHPFRKQKKAFNGQQEFLPALILMIGEQIYNEVHIENKWGKGKRTNNKASENQEDTRGRGGKIQKQKRNTTKEEGSSSQVNGQNEIQHLLHVSAKTKDGVNARLDLAELGVKPELFAMQEEDKTTLPPTGYTLTNAEKDTFCETLHNIRVPLGHKVDPFILASQARQVFYVKDRIDKKLSIVFKTPPKNYKDTYDEVDEEFSTVIHMRNDNILPRVNQHDLGNESRDDCYRTDCGDIKKDKACMLAKAQASEASSKAKVEACGSKVKVETCGSKAKLQASTKTLIVKIPIPITNCVLGRANAKTWDAIKGKTFRVKIPPTMTFTEVKIGKMNLRSGK